MTDFFHIPWDKRLELCRNSFASFLYERLLQVFQHVDRVLVLALGRGLGLGQHKTDEVVLIEDFWTCEDQGGSSVLQLQVSLHYLK